MGQRINIQYSVDIDNLDDEVGRLIEESHARYSSLQDAYKNTSGAVLSNETLERIDRIRVELAAVDHRLNDVVNIISGYLHYRAQENYAQQLPAQDNSSATNEELEEKLNKFKSLVEGTENEVSNQGS
jgi:hypothetical protein|tara:strand:- start:1088 stop:1471 length:384 start_codon:yes stop_codon:yes gene_type:complete